MKSGYFSIRGIRRLTLLAVLAGLQTLVAAQATPIGDFVTNANLDGTNMGRAANAVQVTCAELIAIGATNPLGMGQEHELWRRCNELVVTAVEFNNGAPIPDDGNPMTPPPRTLGYCESSGCSNDGDLLAAFQQVNGEEVQAGANLSQTASYDQFSTIGARVAALRGGSSSSVTSVAANSADFMYGSGGGAAADSAAPFGPWGWFVRGTYTSGERDPSEAATSFAGAENGFDYDQYGVTIGIDHRSGSSVFGFALGYNSYEVEMQTVRAAGTAQNAADAGTIETDSINGTFFYDVSSENNVYFSALAGFGSQSFDMLRNFIYFEGPNSSNPTVNNQQRFMTADPDGDSFSAAFTLGRAVVRGSWVFDPYLGVTHDRVTVDGFAEVDSGNAGIGIKGMQLAFDEQKIDSVRSRLGFQLSNNVNTSFGSVRPMFSAEWFHEFEDNARVIRAKYSLEDTLATNNQGDFTAGFGADCVSCFDIVSDDPEDDYFVVGLGIAATTQRGLQSFLMVEGLLGHSYLSAVAVTVGLRGQF